jgi:hypothetical protein
MGKLDGRPGRPKLMGKSFLDLQNIVLAGLKMLQQTSRDVVVRIPHLPEHSEIWPRRQPAWSR